MPAPTENVLGSDFEGILYITEPAYNVIDGYCAAGYDMAQKENRCITIVGGSGVVAEFEETNDSWVAKGLRWMMGALGPSKLQQSPNATIGIAG